MKKIPMRRCLATNQSFPKKDLLRVVRTPEGEIKVDLTEPYSPGICYSTITLYYYPSVDDLSFVEKYTIEPYEANRYL